MKTTFLTWLVIAGTTLTATAQQLTSPNGKLTVTPIDYGITVSFQQQTVLDIMTPQLSVKSKTPKLVTADYEMLSGKRLHCTNEGNEYRLSTDYKNLTLVLRVYNDGIAFRYETADAAKTSVWNETTAYLIPEGTRRWMQQWRDSYEGFFPLETSYQVKPESSRNSKSAEGWNNRWGYPALVEAANTEGPVYALITEANIETGQSASCLYNDGEFYRVVPDERKRGTTIDHTPWRVVIIGTLADVVASTLVTDVSEPCRIADTSWIEPGVVSWVYWAYNHGSNDCKIIKKYTDLAAALKLPYVLIDAEWDQMLDDKTVEDAVAYARSQGVKPMIWYNSCVGWIDGAPTPKFRLNKPVDREKEFAWCEKIGVAGVKIDFFSGDTQLNMDYCLELLECAARHHLLVNFHGATVPRGWQRTWPNLMSTEGVYGAEWYNNVPTFTTRAARHNATLPFTRNVIGPMDYTPCAFSDSQHPHITSHAHELALTVLYESALQHLADRPESLLAQPAEVQQFFSSLPTVWDETRLVSGYPGEDVVMARRHGHQWYVAGINGTDDPKDITLALDFIGNDYTQCTLFADSGKVDAPWLVTTSGSYPSTLTLQPRGGFVLVIK